MSEHKKCPFCPKGTGSVRKWEDPEEARAIYYHIQCVVCGATGALCEDVDEAWEAWDRRDDAAVKELVAAANAVQRLVYDDKLRAELQKAAKKVEGL